MIGLNYLDNFVPRIKCKLKKELNYRGELKYSKKEKWYGLKHEAYNYYVQNVRDNENLTYNQVKKKLSSNVLSGVKIMIDRNGMETYRYGNMIIKVRNDRIVYVCNNKGMSNFNKYEFDIDMRYRDYLRKLWGVNGL